MHKKRCAALWLLILMAAIVIQMPVAQAAGVDSLLGALSAGTMPSDGSTGGGLFSGLFSLLFEKILGPILNIFGGQGRASSAAGSGGSVKVTPIPPKSNSDPIQDSGLLRGKVIVVDPGHGGSNPGAVANGTHEADNNLAVALKLRDRLARAGAKVIMTRAADTTVAPPGSPLGEELQARLDVAKANGADIFVSIHSNSNPDESIAGAMTFYPSGKSNALALDVQNAVVRQTQAVDKGTSPATFYVLRNAAMPSILIEMGFVSNPSEAVRLQDDAYRNRLAQGIFDGLVSYFSKK